MEAILTVSAMQRPHLTESSYVSALRIKSCRQRHSLNDPETTKQMSAVCGERRTYRRVEGASVLDEMLCATNQRTLLPRTSPQG